MKRQYLLLLALLLLLVLATGAALQGATLQGAAGQGPATSDYHLKWNVIVAGGRQSSSTSYLLDGTAGGSLVGPPSASSADYLLTLGYTTGGSMASHHLYLPLVVR
jgi:hypothetical protein